MSDKSYRILKWISLGFLIGAVYPCLKYINSKKTLNPDDWVLGGLAILFLALHSFCEHRLKCEMEDRNKKMEDYVNEINGKTE